MKVANDNTHHIQSCNSRTIKEDLPTTFVTAAPTSNGYFHVDTSRKQNDVFRRRSKKLSSKETYKMSRLCVMVVVGFFYCSCIAFYKLLTYSRTNETPETSVLSSFKSNFTVIFSHHRVRRLPRKLTLPIIKPLSAADDKHDFGNLKLRFAEYGTSHNFGRVIYHDTYEDTGYHELWGDADDDGDMESYYAFDDDDKRNPLVMYDDPDIHFRKKCRRTNWHRELPIACNTLHEYDFPSHIGMGDARFLGYVDQIFSSFVSYYEKS